jgi:L-lactate dehydrogenase (cytochrome)
VVAVVQHVDQVGVEGVDCAAEEGRGAVGTGGAALARRLAAGGGPGVTRALDILTADLVRTMKLLGADRIADLHPGLVSLKPDFRVD